MNGSLANAVRSDWFGPLLVTIVAVAIVGGFNPSFLSPLNIQVLLLAIAVNGLIAFSQMLIIAIGQMNLSVGAIGGLCAIVFAGMMDAWHVPASLAALSALSLGVICGVINGFLIARTGISAFVITLASLSVYKGINLGITHAQPFYNISDGVKSIGQGAIFGIIPWLMLPTMAVG
ncbi:ABC transporter permease, partial [Mesorhizobium sp. M1076]